MRGYLRLDTERKSPSWTASRSSISSSSRYGAIIAAHIAKYLGKAKTGLNKT